MLRGVGAKQLACVLAAALMAALLPGVGRAADVDITTNTASEIDLGAAGGTAEVAAGVVVHPTLSPFRAIYAATGSWALTNRGSLSGNGLASVELRGAGSAVTNYGSITAPGDNAVLLFNGGTVDNKAGATISGGSFFSAINIGHSSGGGAGPGTVTNAGTLSSSAGTVILAFGGSVTNLLGGTISTTGSGSTAVTIQRGASRFVSNAGTIQSTGAGYAEGITLQTGDSTVINTATGSILGGFNGIYAPDAVLTLTNDGSISSTRVASTAYAVEADLGGTIVNTGTISSLGDAGLYLGRAGTVTNSGTIHGLTNAIKFGGNYTRTLNLNTGSVLEGNVLGGTGTDNLVLLGNGTESAAKFSNFETLSMQGTDWTLSGNGTFATSAEVQTGTLTVGGTLTSLAIAIRAAGTVTGNGTLAGAVDNAGKILVSSGTLAVTGSFTAAAGSSLAIGVTPASNGVLAVTGAATISGGTVNVLAGSGSYAPSTVYTILTTTAGRTGTFAGVTSNFAFLSPTLSYDGNNAYLTLTRGLVSFASAGRTRNQIATGGGIDTLPGSNPLLPPLALLDMPSAAAAFDQLSGEIYGAAQGALADESRYPRDAALDRIDASFAAIDAGKRGHTNIWAQGLGGTGTLESDGNAARRLSGTGGLLLGADGLIDGDVLVGVLGGISHSELAIPDRQSSAHVDSYHLGVTAATNANGFRIKAGAIGSIDGVVVDRTASFAGFSDTTRGTYLTTSGQLFGELSYAIAAGRMTLVPYGRLALIGVGGGSYAEAGGNAALRGTTDGYGLALATLGLSASTDFELGDKLLVTARGRIGVQQGFGSAPTATHHFAGGGDFTVAGAPPGGLAVTIDTSLAADIGPATSVEVSYAGRIGATGASHGLKATLSGKF